MARRRLPRILKNRGVKLSYALCLTSVASCLVVTVYPAKLFAAAPARRVIYISACACQNNHGVARWRAKTDRSEPPPNRHDVQPITPSEMFNWQGPGLVPRGGGRMGVETRWFALTGRVINLQVETDGDVHMVLADATDNNAAHVIAEIPLGVRWCNLRTLAFSWTNAVFPFELTRDRPFELIRHPLVTLVGKAFYDTDHSGKDYRNNRRPRAKDKAVWEIHPVMEMTVQEAPPPVATATSPPASPDVVPPPATPAPPADASAQLVVTLTKPVSLKIPYGSVTLPAGRQLSAISRDDANVVVLFEGKTYSIPLDSTDVK